MKKLLSIDFDYFFPTNDPTPGAVGMFDWGHHEGQAFLFESIWPVRAASFLERGLPLPQVNDEWRTFWDRFTFKPGAKLFYADSHAQIMRLISIATFDVWNFDAHHDCGYLRPVEEIVDSEMYDCGEWGVAVVNDGGRMRVRYPRWLDLDPADKPLVEADVRVDDGKPVLEAGFDEVFVCRSGVWVPSWCDEAFDQFIELAPFGEDDLYDFGNMRGEPLAPREFSLADAEELARQMAKVREEYVGT